MTAAALRIAIAMSVAASFAAAAADNEATRVFTIEIAQKVLGGPIAPSARNSADDTKSGSIVVSQCSYSAKNGETPPSVSLTLRKTATVEEAKNTFLSSKKIYNGQDVAGLGDLAYRTAAPAQLNVLKGRDWLIITAGVFPVADVSLQEKAAREILKNIHD